MKLAQVIMDAIRTRFPHSEIPKDVIHKAAMNWLRNSRDLHGGRKEKRTKRKMIVRTLRILITSTIARTVMTGHYCPIVKAHKTFFRSKFAFAT